MHNNREDEFPTREELEAIMIDLFEAAGGEPEEARDDPDEFIAYLRELKKNSIPRQVRPNMTRISQFGYAYAVLHKIIAGQNAEISCKIDELFGIYGSISVKGAALELRKPEEFARVIEIADNMEVYPLLNGTICMSFMFYGMTEYDN